MRVIEYHGRGLPHSHILLWIKDCHKCFTAEQINQVVSCELPVVDDDSSDCQKRLRNAVVHHMIHTCGEGRCLVDGKCSKGFPKPFSEETVVDSAGDFIPRRRNNGDSVVTRYRDPSTGKVTEQVSTNQYVVPYNRYCLAKYNSHTNIERVKCFSVLLYLLGYMLTRLKFQGWAQYLG